MRYAVIEIGYNTIKMVIFEIIQGKLIRLHSQNEFVEITNYSQEDLLNNDGIIIISEIIQKMQQTAKLLQCDKIICFATTLLRYLKNKNEIIDIINQRNNITIDILSSENEINAVFNGINYEFNLQNNGIACDISDGSTQIFTFSKGSIQESISIPIGNIKLYNMFVEGILPRPCEMEEINKLTKDLFNKYNFLQKQKSRTLYLSGDTGRALARLHMKLNGQSEKLHGYTIKKEAINIIIEALRNKHLNGIDLINRIIPERINTIIPGMTELAAICNIAGIDEIIITRNGVKEGYLLNYYQQNKKTEKSCIANINA